MALVSTSASSAFFCPRCGSLNLHLVAALFAQQLFQHLAIFEVHRHMDAAGDVLLVEINLLQQRREEFVRLEIEQILPEVFAAIDNAAVAQVEQIGGTSGGSA